MLLVCCWPLWFSVYVGSLRWIWLIWLHLLLVSRLCDWFVLICLCLLECCGFALDVRFGTLVGFWVVWCLTGCVSFGCLIVLVFAFILVCCMFSGLF